ncbi:hypothetical protein FHW36_109121 [Chitinophaga polysaccharea]|uniref:Uncharacterized protein n=1 Tax=Chitinophaga polysaccharea TaxID=1293035 RepID=A0A561PB21_9BACT|nr:hypothetical protein FHW36_109121 [Chitinophaga polysaccharea]
MNLFFTLFRKIMKSAEKMCVFYEGDGGNKLLHIDF